MNRKLEILHLEDDTFDAEIIETRFASEDLDAVVTRAQSRREFEEALNRAKFDLIISDYSIPGFDGLSALKMAREKCPETPFIFASGTIGEERAIDALKEGATDYVIKDRPARLVPAIRRALANSAAAKEQRQAAEQIREQALLLDRARDAICLLALDHTILFWNRGAVALYGWSAAEALGRNADELLFAGDRAMPGAALNRLMNRGEWQGELPHVTRAGRKLAVESRWTLLRDANDQPKSILVINSDITEKKLIEAQLLRTQRMDSIGALAGGIAHDLNNCLTPVLLGMSLIEQELTSPPALRMLDIMRASTQRGVDMVKQILAFARGAGGEHTVVELRQLIRDMVRLAEETFPRSLEIQNHVAPDLAPIMGNSTQLNQVMLNLCVNARDAMPEGGRLRLEAENVILDDAAARAKQLTAGLHVRLSVSDTGQGMTPQVLQRIFEPFFTTKDLGKGTGLGLSTVLGIVKTHGGAVEAVSEAGRGSVFTVLLPATRSLPGSAAGARSPEMAMGQGEHILLVDDEAAVLEVTRLLLESFGYNVVTAHNGEEAVSVYRRHPAGVDLVITDMMMPAMNGEETIAALREANPAVKIIGVSGLGSGTRLANAGRSMGDAFLKKPFTTTDLLATMRRILPVQTN